ncbi:MAG: hypothetical protein ABI647_15555 [Gemmatimonadota bacterium]
MTSGQSLRPADRSAADIARSLREEFTRSLYESTGAQAQPDPVLGALFHALAVQVDRVYQEADHVFFDAALNDLIRGLGLPPRLARPAQTVVQFTQLEQRELVSSENELIGYRPNADQIIFAPDAPIEIAPTDLVFAGVYEGGRLTTIAGARIPEANAPILPGTSAPLALPGAAPTIFLAFRSDSAHLSRLGIYFELGQGGADVGQALGRSPWQLLDGAGRVTEPGVLRPTPSRGGMRRLAWFRAGPQGAEPESESGRALDIMSGPYGSRVWLFPQVPVDRRWVGGVPPALRGVVNRLLPPGHDQALEPSAAWVQIPLPAGTRGVANAISRIAVNCVTASNVEVWNERIDFNRMGSVVSHAPYGSTQRHVMAVLSVTGEIGTAYVDAGDLEAPPTSGRYRYRGAGRFEFAPARQESGRFDTYAMLRLLYCDGDNGNGIDVGEVKQIRVDLPRNPIARVTSLTPTKGGAAPPAYVEARLRFAELLRTRERIVTAGDIDAAARAFEPLIRSVDVEAASEITDLGLGLVTRVAVNVSPDDFADPEADFERLQVELQRYLEERTMIGHRLLVSLRTVGKGR